MTLVDMKERPTLAIRYRTTAADLPTGMGAVFGEIASYMGRKGIRFAGPPYAMYHNMDMNDLDVEIGFPVGRSAQGEGRVVASVLPEGRFATAKHVGSYETIGETYDKLTAFISGRGLKPGAMMYEEYLNSPEDTPVERLETDIYCPVK